MAEATRSPRGARILGVFTALLSGLAVGAVWCMLVVFSGRDLIALAPVCAIAIAWVLRTHAFAGSTAGAVLAAAMTIVACAYSLYLQSAMQISYLLGVSFRDALLHIGPGLAYAMAWYDTGTFQLAVFVLAPLLAAWLVLRRQR